MRFNDSHRAAHWSLLSKISPQKDAEEQLHTLQDQLRIRKKMYLTKVYVLFTYSTCAK